MFMHLSPKERISYVCVVGIVLAGLAYVGGQHLRQPAKIVFNGGSTDGSSKVPAGADPAPVAEVIVDVVGAVKHPGLQHLPAGARVADALSKAGGALAGADLEKLNLAAKLVDGTQLRVHDKQEAKNDFSMSGAISPLVIPELHATPKSAKSSLPSSSRSKRRPQAAPATKDIYAAPVEGADSSDPTDKPPTKGSRTAKNQNADFSVNEATEEDLIHVPGIGKVTAAKIVEYRQANGPFKSMEDLRHVRGIGAKKLESLRKYLHV